VRSGAKLWADQALAELVATIERLSRDTTSSLRSLNAEELQITLVVAQGSTTLEAAAALFLSPKTVEFHLGNTYRNSGRAHAPN
jgi:DNA-binding NarL/FixJ family response regulator